MFFVVSLLCVFLNGAAVGATNASTEMSLFGTLGVSYDPLQYRWLHEIYGNAVLKYDFSP
jgi:hypothetical protein